MMANKTQHTDPFEQLLKDSFNDYTIPEFGNSWIKIKMKYLIKNLLKFNPYQFNAYYGIALLSTAITVGTLIKKTDSQHEILINDQLQNKSINTTATLSLDKEISPDSNNVLFIKQEENKIALETSTPVAKKVTSLNAKDNGIKKIDQISKKERTITNTNNISANDTVSTILKPLISLPDSAFIAKNDSSVQTIDSTCLIIDSQDSIKKMTTDAIVMQEPVIKTDTIVKVIRKRRIRKKQ